MLATWDWRLALVYVGLLPLVVLGMWAYARRVRPAWRRVQRQLAALTGTLQESLAGILVVKLFGREPFGQRQLVPFARALVADPRILVLGDATANVDAYTEALIQGAMDEIRRDRTTVIIAHRFSTLRKADRIVAVDAGRIVGQGSHEDLIESNPTYQRLYRRQWAGNQSE